MLGNAEFRWFLLAAIIIGLLLVITSPVISWAGEGFGEWNEEALKICSG